MAEQLPPQETISAEELLISNVYQIEALISLLDKKGLISKEEVIEEITRLRKQQKV